MPDAKRNRSGTKIDQPLDKAAALPSALLIQRSWEMSQHYLTAGSGTVASRPFVFFHLRLFRCTGTAELNALGDVSSISRHWNRPFIPGRQIQVPFMDCWRSVCHRDETCLTLERLRLDRSPPTAVACSYSFPFRRHSSPTNKHATAALRFISAK